ncbi:hypothetical protein NKH57_17555 [Mesorhizobium sp. M1050]|uniref:hypothetical protein n=1 Tax=Mesorhizobium sp. M1050 TaxID=2957051 RepID=UPI003335E1BC
MSDWISAMVARLNDIRNCAARGERFEPLLQQRLIKACARLVARLVACSQRANAARGLHPVPGRHAHPNFPARAARRLAGDDFQVEWKYRGRGRPNDC